jgi:lantibiotic modifying enzyme
MESSILCKDAELRVTEIAACIYKVMKTNPYNTVQGLLGENFGALLFLYYYADFTKDAKYTQLAEDILDKLLTQLESNWPGFSYASGYAGILYLFHFLQEKKIVSLDFSDSEEIMENYLIKEARNCMHVNDYDYLHGSLGVVLYFLKKNPNHPFLSEFVEFLYHTAEKDSLNHTVKWKTPYGIKEKRVYDYHLSLSHGMTSMVIFLCRLLKSESFSASNDCLTMLEGCMNYILLQEIDHTQYGSWFSNKSLESDDSPMQSRLAWCFGDLGIASALWQAGIAVNNRPWQDKAIEIMKHAARRVNREQTALYDCGICHGSAGIAMVFRRFYLETREKIFHNAWFHWVDFTLNFKRFDDGLAGFKTFEIQEWKNDISLLTGISGIGLMLLSFIRDDLQEWDELFIMS